MNTILTFYTDGTFHCLGLGQTRTVKIGIGHLVKGEIGCESCPDFGQCRMSHTSQVTTSIRDINAIKEACKSLGLKAPTVDTITMYDGKKATGVVVQLNGWRFPIVIDQKTGQIQFDNYNGSWGAESELNRFKQAYGIAKAKLIAKKQGLFVKQFTLPNGTVRLQVTGM